MPLSGSDTLHALNNHVSVIVVLCELMLESLPDGQVREDILEIQKAAAAVLQLLPCLQHAPAVPTQDPDGDCAA
jgi:hypothetical protein